MRLDRRSFLSTSATIGLAAAFAPAFRYAAAAELSTEQYRQLSDRWVDIITGRNLIDPEDSRYSKALGALDSNVAAILEDLVRTPDRERIFSSIDLQSPKSVNVTQTAVKIQTLAIAWATPGSKYYHNPEVLQDCIDALRDFMAIRYHPGQEAYDNWWSWEIGSSRAVSDVMCILRDELPKDVMDNAAASIEFFVPDPWYLRTNKAAGSASGADARTVATGANRLDLSLSAICAALITEDAARIRHTLEGIPDTLRIVETGDGFYRDGSFIQHVHVPYTGSYGDVFLTGLSMLFTLVSDSAFNVPVEQQAAAYRAVDESFIPVMVDGQVLDAVRGRSVSRLDESKNMRGASITKAILLLAQGAPAEIAQRWQSLCVGWIQRNEFDRLDTQGSITHLALVANALANAEPSAGLSKPRMFASMDRLVHRTPDWVMAISLCSDRIAWYECGNGENELASRTGSGMRYLYLQDDMGQFEDGFWPTLDYTSPPGATVDSHPLEPKAAGEWGEQTPDNEWTGGLTQGESSVAAMHLIGPDANGLQARRMWYGNKQGMVEAVTDVQTSADQAWTVVERRNLGEKGGQKLLVDGKAVSGTADFTNPKWAHLEGVAGYVFLTPALINAKVEQRTGRWSDINHFQKSQGVEGVDNELTRHWASLHFAHTPETNAGAWLVLPKATAEETQELATALHGDQPSLTIRHNDANAQVIQDQDVTTWAVWQPGTYADMTFVQPTVALTHHSDDRIHLTAADPTQKADQLRLELAGHWQVVDGKKVTSTMKDNDTVVIFDCSHLAGSHMECVLERVS